MQSSPPTRAWDRGEPRSPANESQYSLDLGALDLDGHSGTSSPVAKPRVDRVFSEDIDGPSDFTLNMGKWMKGGGGTLGRGQRRNGLGSIKERVQPRDQIERPEDQQLEEPQSPQLHDEDMTESHHTPEDSPPRESVWGPTVHEKQTVNEHNDHEEPGSSEWDPYGQASTPQPPVHKQFLQPTVEDYHSELMPPRAASYHAPASIRTHDTLPRGRSTYTRHSEPSTPGRASSPTLSPVRSPIVQRSMPQAQDSSPPTETILDRQLQQLQAKCQQLGHLNNALKQALDDEQRIRKQEDLAHKAQMSEATRREQDLREEREELQNRAEDVDDDLAEQKDRTLKAEAQAEAERHENQRLKELHASELRSIREQMQRQKDEHSPRLHALEQSLQLARRARDEAEGAAKAHRAELDEYRDSHDAELERLRLTLDDTRDAHTTVADLESQLHKSKSDLVSLQASKEAAEERATHLQTELAGLELRQRDNANHLNTDHDRAVSLADDLQKKLKDLQQQMRDQHAEHEAAVEKMQSSHVQAQQDLSDELDSLRTEHEAHQSQLNSAILERDEAHDSLTNLQTELETLKADLVEKESVEKEFDAGISEKIQKREAYWREKLRESRKENRVMAQALLHQWGREEMGVDSPQTYKYKFVGREEGVQAST